MLIFKNFKYIFFKFKFDFDRSRKLKTHNGFHVTIEVYIKNFKSVESVYKGEYSVILWI